MALARRIAKAIHKLHRAGVPTERTHTMADELRILQEHFRGDANEAELGKRIDRILDLRSARHRITPPQPCGFIATLSGPVIVDGAHSICSTSDYTPRRSGWTSEFCWPRH